MAKKRTKKRTHGGRRKGAGRPKHEEELVKKSVTLRESLYLWASARGKLSAVINEALEALRASKSLTRDA